MKKHLVLDIEMLGVEYGSQILSVGAVCGNAVFHKTNIYTPKFQSPTIDIDTVKWWMTKTSSKAQCAAFDASNGVPALCDVLEDFRRFIERTQPDYFWGNAPDFDFGHLAYWYKKASQNIPWKYWQLRDIRTIKDFVDPVKVKEIQSYYTPHVAIEDAKCEYAILMEFLKNQRQKI